MEPVRLRSQRSFATTKNSEKAFAGDEDCGCDDPPQVGGSKERFDTDTMPIGILLRDTILTNIEGNPVKLGNYISDAGTTDATIVVFLRHLA